MTIDQQIEELLSQIDELMQELRNNRVPCEELIKKVISRLGNFAYYNYLAGDTFTDAFIDPAHHWIGLRKLNKPIAVDGNDATNLSWVTIEINNKYWWSATYAEQLIIVQSLPKLLEKVMERVRQECIVQPTTIVFDAIRPPKVKHHWWQFWRK
jgi:hypothetical protein